MVPLPAKNRCAWQQVCLFYFSYGSCHSPGNSIFQVANSYYPSSSFLATITSGKKKNYRRLRTAERQRISLFGNECPNWLSNTEWTKAAWYETLCWVSLSGAVSSMNAVHGQIVQKCYATPCCLLLGAQPPKAPAVDGQGFYFCNLYCLSFQDPAEFRRVKICLEG